MKGRNFLTIGVTLLFLWVAVPGYATMITVNFDGKITDSYTVFWGVDTYTNVSGSATFDDSDVVANGSLSLDSYYIGLRPGSGLQVDFED